MSNKREAGYYHVMIQGEIGIAVTDSLCWIDYDDDEIEVLDETPIKLLSGNPSPAETLTVKLTIEPQNMDLWTEFTKNMEAQAKYFEVVEG